MPAQAHATQIPFRDEDHFQSEVIRHAEARGWKVMHISDSRKEVRRGGVSFLVGDKLAKGYPDLTLVHPRHGIFAVRELKQNHTRLEPEQEEWLKWLRAAGVDADVWRPRDLNAIERFLAGPTRGR